MIPEEIIIEYIKNKINQLKLMKTIDEKANIAIELFEYLLIVPYFVNEHKKLKKTIIEKAKEHLIYIEYPELIHKCELLLEIYDNDMEIE